MNNEFSRSRESGSVPATFTSRRNMMQMTGLALTGLALPRTLEASEVPLKPVAAITTVYYPYSHADLLIGKILHGYDHAGGRGPRLRLPAMYMDKVHKHDIGLERAKEHNVTLVETVEQAITLGTNQVAVEGVLIIGELGEYPKNTKGQTYYPRARMFEDVVATFRKYGKVVPVFNDKHLAYNWHNAKWIYDTALEMKIPFMAGSVLPFFWRDPPLALPLGCEVEQAMAIGYSDLDSYAIHTMEALQCQLERRKGGESGVSSVQTVTGDEVFRLEKEGKWSREMYHAIMARFPPDKRGSPEDKLGKGQFIFIEYRDGFQATLVQLEHNRQWGVGAKLKGQRKPLTSWYKGLYTKGSPVFAHQFRAIEKMFLSGKPSYPVERTLLTTGILDAAMTSRFEFQRKVETPHLDIRYEPVDYPFPSGEVRPVTFG